MLERSPALSITSLRLPESIAVAVDVDLARPIDAATPFDVTAAVTCGAVAVLIAVTLPLFRIVSAPSAVRLSLVFSTLTVTPKLSKSIAVSTLSDFP